LALDTAASIDADRRSRADERRARRAARAALRGRGVPLPGWLTHVRPGGPPAREAADGPEAAEVGARRDASR
ncbi:MAG TPA: hypothetical protein VFO60_11295, partial [Candidatus Dormibacteraeota bacterium]|nr:hypothetical protein [Candidatus Dormibacteraeota bacterium]